MVESVVVSKMKNVIFITWEKHRRTKELANSLDVELFELTYDGLSFIRYLVLIGSTFSVILRNRPKVLIVQLPSVILALEVCILKLIFHFSLIIDAHNAGIIPEYFFLKPFIFIYKLIHSWADLILVSNSLLKKKINSYSNAKVVVFPDIIPNFIKIKNCSQNLLFIFAHLPWMNHIKK